MAGVDSNSEVDYIEELIDKQEPIVKVLRVLCLMSLVQGGIKAKVLEHFKREIIQVCTARSGGILESSHCPVQFTNT